MLDNVHRSHSQASTINCTWRGRERERERGRKGEREREEGREREREGGRIN